jgi:hypothetical protein
LGKIRKKAPAKREGQDTQQHQGNRDTTCGYYKDFLTEVHQNIDAIMHHYDEFFCMNLMSAKSPLFASRS